jgi:hypothetical protein
MHALYYVDLGSSRSTELFAACLFNAIVFAIFLSIIIDRIVIKTNEFRDGYNRINSIGEFKLVPNILSFAEDQTYKA